jgi:hypothetical protein
MASAIPWIIAAAVGYKMLNKNGSASGAGNTAQTINPGNIPVPKPGQPALKIDKVRKLLNRVDYTFNDGKGNIKSFQHKWKDWAPTRNIVGGYVVMAVTQKIFQETGKTDAEGNSGISQEYGPVDITVQNSKGTVITAKRILVNEGKIIDLK